MDNPLARPVATGHDLSRHDAPSPDSDFTLTIDDALDRYAKAGHPRTPRSIQRYCAKGHIEGRLIETPFGEKWLITPTSIDKHIAYIEEVSPTTGRDASRPDATGRDLSTLSSDGAAQDAATTQPTKAQQTGDTPRPAPTPVDDRYVVKLESENEFLRGQIGVKDGQIKELTERARETNVLIAGLQKMLSPLLGSGESRRPGGLSDDIRP